MSTRNSTRVVLLAATGLLVSSPVLSESESGSAIPEAQCTSIKRNTTCVLRWKVKGAGRENIMIQQWGRESTTWQDIKDVVIYDPNGEKSLSVRSGHLYRVLSCATESTAECRSSNVVWAPVWKSIEEIPDTVDVEMSGHINRFSVSKVDSHGELHLWRDVITQYNMYLLLQNATGFLNAKAPMPTMNIPAMNGEAPDSVEEMVAYNVQQQYESMRAEVLRQRLIQN